MISGPCPPLMRYQCSLPYLYSLLTVQIPDSMVAALNMAWLASKLSQEIIMTFQWQEVQDLFDEGFLNDWALKVR